MILTQAKKDIWYSIDEVLESEVRSDEDRSSLMRVLELGLHPEVELCLRHIAPLGDPVTFEINGGLIALNKDLCRFFRVREVQRV